MKTASWKVGSMVLCGSFLFVFLFGCATLPPKAEKLPPFNGFDGVKWGTPVEEVKKAVEAEGKKVFEDQTRNPPYAFYATGTHLNSPAVLAYYFTPRSKKLYRVDAFFKDVTVHRKVLDHLVGAFGKPFHSKPGVDHWTWTDHTLVILQRDPNAVQIAYQGGEWSEANHREGNGLSQ